MTDQPTLFASDPHGLTRMTDPATSLAAARSITPGRTEGLILDVFEHAPDVWLRGGLTDDELAALLPQCHAPTVKSARSRLSNLGVLVDSGQTRPSLRGRASIVWRAA